MIGDHDREHMEHLRNIELALDLIGMALEQLVGKIEQVTGKDDLMRSTSGRRFLRTVDIWRHRQD